jgi:hypothetical protein
MESKPMVLAGGRPEPVLDAARARERLAREWAALRRGHVFLSCDGKVIRQARAARLRVVWR